MATQQEAENSIADMIFGPEEAEAEETNEPLEAAEEEESPEVEEEGDEEEIEASEASESAEEGEEPEYVEIEINGKLYDIPADISQEFIYQSDYTKKTQEVAASKKAIEAEQALIAQERQQYEFLNSVQGELLQAQQIEQAIPQWQTYLRENIDSLSTTEIEKIRFSVDELKEQRDAIQQSLQEKYKEHQQAQEQVRKELLDKSTEVLKGKLADFSVESVAEYVKTFGFTDDQVAMAQLDPKQMELAYKAMKYDQLQQGKAQAVAKAKSAPKIKAKSRNPMPKETQDKLNLRKKLKNPNLRSADKAKAIGEDIASRMFPGG